MKVNKIIFITQTQFTEKSFDRFGVQLLTNRGFQVEIWECSPYITPALFEAYNSSDTFPFSGYKLFRSGKLLLKAIDALTKHDVIVTFISNTNIKTRRIYKRISKKGIPWGSVQDGQIPTPKIFKGFWSRAQRFFRSPVLLISFLLKSSYFGWGKLRSFQFLSPNLQ